MLQVGWGGGGAGRRAGMRLEEPVGDRGQVLENARGYGRVPSDRGDDWTAFPRRPPPQARAATAVFRAFYRAEEVLSSWVSRRSPRDRLAGVQESKLSFEQRAQGSPVVHRATAGNASRRSDVGLCRKSTAHRSARRANRTRKSRGKTCREIKHSRLHPLGSLAPSLFGHLRSVARSRVGSEGASRVSKIVEAFRGSSVMGYDRGTAVAC